MAVARRSSVAARPTGRPRRLFGARTAPGHVPLAWRNVIYDRKRLVRSAAGIGFAVLLMLIQLGFRNAFLDSSLALLDSIDGDLMIISATKYRLGVPDTFPRRRLYQSLGVDGIERAAPLHAEWTRSIWKNPQTRESFAVQVVAFHPDRPVLGIPGILEQVDALKRADTVLMDRRARGFLGQGEAGLETELAGRHVTIAGTFALGPDFASDGTVVTSERTFFNLFPDHLGSGRRSTEVEIGVLEVAQGHDPIAVQDAVRAILPGDVVVLTKQELLDLETSFQNDVSPVGLVFLAGTLIGFAVGILISYQIMYTDLSDFLPQFATLKAIGYRNRYMLVVTLQQAVFYALLGFGPAWVMTIGIFVAVGEAALLPMRMTLALTIGGLLLTVGMCVISGLIAVRRVLRADPAEVF
jgi:putative ABC transport system permease protein